MTLGEWYVALYALGAGIGIAGFWAVVLATGRLASLLPDASVARAHVVAELLTAALLVAAGVAAFAGPDAAWVRALHGLALGAALYALVGSVGFYTRFPAIRVALVGGALAAVPAVVLVLAGR